LAADSFPGISNYDRNSIFYYTKSAKE